MTTNYVSIEKRMRTLMTRIEIELNDPRRQVIKETLQRLAEDVRERCAVEAIALEPRGTAENRGVKWAHAECIAAAIRKLEL